MPEGDTIWRTAAALRPRLVGRRVLAARPAPLARLTGTTITAVDAVGKHLLVRFDNGLSLHTHMRMTGAWHVYRPGEPWRKPERLARAVLEVDGTVAVLFNAPVVELTRHDDRTSHLGPDILAENLDLDLVVRRARSLGSVPVGEVLLDQRVSAGIGNIWRNEALWTERVNPWRASTSLSDAQLRALYAWAHTEMRAHLRGPHRRSIVHGRGGRPCPRCGTLIKVRAQGEQARLTYWCPHCQGGDQYQMTGPSPVAPSGSHRASPRA
ncbi:MAG TPA: DNA-formamidopyrimidine glycosylase family protein [Candidatus Dormibacteraeota bacterium]